MRASNQHSVPIPRPTPSMSCILISCSPALVRCALHTDVHVCMPGTAVCSQLMYSTLLAFRDLCNRHTGRCRPPISRTRAVNVLYLTRCADHTYGTCAWGNIPIGQQHKQHHVPLSLAPMRTHTICNSSPTSLYTSARRSMPNCPHAISFFSDR